MSESTSREWAWATSSGPRCPPASVEKRCPSTNLTPTVTGSIPSTAQTRSRNDIAGNTSRSTSPRSAAADSNSTVRSSTIGEPGTT